MSSKGLKNQLLARLQKALKSEQDIEEKGVEEVVQEVPKEVEKPGEKGEDDENKKKEVLSSWENYVVTVLSYHNYVTNVLYVPSLL